MHNMQWSHVEPTAGASLWYILMVQCRLGSQPILALSIHRWWIWPCKRSIGWMPWGLIHVDPWYVNRSHTPNEKRTVCPFVAPTSLTFEFVAVQWQLFRIFAQRLRTTLHVCQYCITQIYDPCTVSSTNQCLRGPEHCQLRWEGSSFGFFASLVPMMSHYCLVEATSW